MNTLARLIPGVICGTIVGTFCGNALSDDSGDLAGLSGRTYLVEATILSSPVYPEYEGAVFPSCFIFEEDGTWIDLEFPGEGQDPAQGVWIQHTELPHISFTATAVEPAFGWTLIEYGVANPGRGMGNQRMQTYAMVFGDDRELVFYVKSEGHEVDACPLL